MGDMGYKDERKSFIYGLNYERHGVTYHFPPEVKFESRINGIVCQNALKLLTYTGIGRFMWT